MEIVAVVFGLLFFYAIHYSIEASNEKKRREKNEYELKRQKEINESNLRDKIIDEKIKSFISFIKHNNTDLADLEYRKEGTYKSYIGHAEFTNKSFISYLKFQKHNFEKKVYVEEYPYDNYIEIKLSISIFKMGNTSFESGKEKINKYYDIDTDELKKVYLKLNESCETKLKIT